MLLTTTTNLSGCMSKKSSEDSVEKEVVVAVNGEESRVVFIDHQHGTMKLENLVMTYEPHAFLVVLAVDDISSLSTVSTCLADCDADCNADADADWMIFRRRDCWLAWCRAPTWLGERPSWWPTRVTSSG